MNRDHTSVSIAVAKAADGTLTYRVAMPPEALPPVRPRDPDAACWAEAADHVAPLASAYGLSRCLRLLAVVALMAEASGSAANWTVPFFTLGRDGADIAPTLLAAAAQASLAREALFDPETLRARLATTNLLGAPA